MRNHITVTIAGQEYTIVAAEEENYVRRVAGHVDNKVQEVLSSVQMMEERAAPMRAKVCPVDVDSDPGMAHFKIPKLQSLKLPEYMDFVASRPCCGCGAAGAGAHITPYIVRHSRLCAHDIYAIPLCQSCQRDIERDRDNWEKTHGRLAMHQRLFFDYALGVGAITSHSSSVR